MKDRVLCKIIILFAVLFSFVGICYAEEEEENKCLLENRVELRESASKVKVSYEPDVLYCRYEADGSTNCNLTDADLEQMQPFLNYGFMKDVLRIKIYNLSPDLVAFIKLPGKDEELLSSNKADENGVISVLVDNVDKIQNVSINVYGAKSPCYLYKVRTIKLTLPKVNPYAVYSPCDEISDYYVCQNYITFDMNFDYFHTHAMEYYNKIQSVDSNLSLDDDSDNNSYASFIGKNKYLIIIIILAIGGGVTAFILLRRRGNNEKK